MNEEYNQDSLAFAILAADERIIELSAFVYDSKLEPFRRLMEQAAIAVEHIDKLENDK